MLNLKNQYKRKLQHLIDVGSFKNREQLYKYIIEHGWEITRDGNNYLGIKNEKSQRFRISLASAPNLLKKPVSLPKAQISKTVNPRTHYVYLLVAINIKNERCGYIGSTTSVKKRLTAHATKLRPNKSSWELHYWAKEHNARISVIILDQTMDIKLAYLLEGLWTHAFESMGFLLLASERWHAAKKKIQNYISYNMWRPHEDFVSKAQLLSDVVTDNIELIVPMEPSPIQSFVVSSHCWTEETLQEAVTQ